MIEQGEGMLPVARAEELVSMKVLSADGERLQDTLDFRSLVSKDSGAPLSETRSLRQA